MQPESSFSPTDMDRLLEKFETDVISGLNPRIENWLERCPKEQHERLCLDMISIEMYHRMKKNPEDVEVEIYHQFGKVALAHAREVFEEYSETDDDIDVTRHHVSQLPAKCGDVIEGKYELVEEIGEGGMGTVWLAHQHKPFHRRVAIKLIRAEKASHEINARFEAERQVLAMMDHPNIAKVFDAGASESGQLFFVMELVDGKSVLEFCNRKQLEIESRLSLFLDVCDAVQHAHKKSIVHRDLKPNNILVAEQNDKPVVKVIDFGLAKALEDTTQLTEKTFETEFGSFAGTVQYMAPEQAELSSRDIDTRTDVYSLGVVLYEMLVGTPPLVRKTLEKTPFLKILEMIRAEVPQSPSVRLSSSTNQLDSITSQRRIAPSRLRNMLRGELDAVVMKALEKDPDRRYQSPNELADDIRRFLNHEAVVARPPSATYKLRKFVRKNRLAVSAAGLLLTVLIGGVVGTTWGMFNANKARVEAESNFEVAYAAIKNYVDTVSNNPQLSEEDFSELKMELLKSTKPFVNDLANNEGQSAQLKKVSAMSKTLMGQIQMETGEIEDARINFVSALGDFATMRTASPETIEHWINAAQTCSALAKYHSLVDDHEQVEFHLESGDRFIDEARKLGFPGHEAKSYVANNGLTLAASLIETGQFNKAIEKLTSSQQITNELVGLFPEELRYAKTYGATLLNLGISYSHLDEFEAAQNSFNSAIETLEKVLAENPVDPQTIDLVARAKGGLADIFSRMGRLSDAQKVYADKVVFTKKLVETFPRNPNYKSALSGLYFSMATLHLRTSEPQPAIEFFRKCCETRSQLAARYPQATRYKHDLATAYSSLGLAQKEIGEIQKSNESLLESISILRELSQEKKSSADCKFTLALNLNNLGNSSTLGGEQENAISCFNEALVLLRKLAKDIPNRNKYRLHLGKTLNNLGNLQLGELKFDEAHSHYREAAGTFAELVEKNSELREARLELSKSYNNGAAVSFRKDDIQAALKQLEACRQVRSKLVEDYPEVQVYRSDLSKVIGNLAAIYRHQDEPDKALKYAEMGYMTAKASVAASPATEEIQIGLTNALVNLPVFAWEAGDHEKAERYWDMALQECAHRVKKFGEKPAALETWSSCLINVASYHRSQGEFSKALSFAKENFVLMEKVIKDYPDQMLLLAQHGEAVTSYARILAYFDKEKAIEHLSDAIESSTRVWNQQPALKSAMKNLSLAYLVRSELMEDKGNLEQATKDVEFIKNELAESEEDVEFRLEILNLRKQFRDDLSKQELELDETLTPEDLIEGYALAKELGCHSTRKYADALRLNRRLLKMEGAQKKSANEVWYEAILCAVRAAQDEDLADNEKVLALRDAAKWLDTLYERYQENPDRLIYYAIWIHNSELELVRGKDLPSVLSKKDREQWQELWTKIEGAFE